MGLFDWLRNAAGPPPQSPAEQEATLRRQADIAISLRAGQVPELVRQRLRGARQGSLPWIATLTPAELLLTRSHGIKPIAAVSATCWMHYGWSWTLGHQQGWETALQRLRAEAMAAGANAVLDVKMRSIAMGVENSMDFTLVGTAVRVEGLPPSSEPIVATVPALEFVKLIDADVVPTGIAIGAQYDWLDDWRGSTNLTWMGNIESQALTRHWESVRRQAHARLRQSAQGQGNGVLAHVNFGEMFEFEGGENQPRRYLARHIVVATVVDARRGAKIPHDIRMVVDLRDGETPLLNTTKHHQSYRQNDEDGAI
jgi:hypothetical protein